MVWKILDRRQRWRLGQWQFALVAITALLVVGTAAISIAASSMQRQRIHEIDRSRQTLDSALQVLSLAKDAETGQRGYLITGEAPYLQPYQSALRQLGPARAAFSAAFTTEYPDRSAQLIAIDQVLDARLDELARLIALRRAGDIGGVQQRVLAGTGKQEMDHLRALLGDIIAGEDAKQRTAQARIGRDTTRANFAIVAASLVALITGALGVLVIAQLLGAYRREEQLLRDARRAERASREKSEFLANMSHEIRTPMNAIIGFSQLLSGLLTGPKERHYLRAILDSGRSLLALINDILDLSKIEAGKLELTKKPTDMREVVRSIANVFSQMAADKHLLLSAEVAADVPESLLLDPLRLRQILFNLIGNALKFTERGGVTVYVSCALDAERETAVDCKLEVRDTGIGIAPEEVQRIFNPFEQARQTTDRRYQGTGLGLSITKRLVDLMEGTIRIDSTPGRGSNFIIDLPNVGISSELPEREGALPSGSRLGELRASLILVVDDVALNRDLLAGFFGGTHHRLLFAVDGESAVRMARRHKPDLVLMDIRMPGVDGRDAFAAIRADPQLQATRVIAITASSLADEETALRRSFDGYIRKPFTRDELYRELARLLPSSEPAAQPASAEIEPADDTDTTTDDGRGALLKQLRTLRDESLPRLRSTLAVREVREFAGGLNTLAEQHRSRRLQRYARELDQAAELFDIAAMETMLGGFAALLDTLERASASTPAAS